PGGLRDTSVLGQPRHGGLAHAHRGETRHSHPRSRRAEALPTQVHGSRVRRRNGGVLRASASSDITRRWSGPRRQYTSLVGRASRVRRRGCSTALRYAILAKISSMTQPLDTPPQGAPRHGTPLVVGVLCTLVAF